MARLRDWPERLDALLSARRHAPFAWGHNDCCMFAADAVLAVTGIDLAAEFRSAYDNERAALRTLQHLGGLEALCDAMLFERVNPATAHVGDVGLAQLDGRGCLAVCGGIHWQAPSQAGLVLIEPQRITVAWRAG